MKYKLYELIDVPRVQRLMDLFYDATGITTALVDLDGQLLTSSGFQVICTDFHRVHPELLKRCGVSDTVIASQIAAGQRYNVYKCKNGLIDAAAPIIVQGFHIGNFFTGQFLFEPPEMEVFRGRAKEFGLDEAAYLEALKKVPIIDEERLPPFLEYFAEFAELLGDMGLKQMQQIEAKDKLTQTLESITDGFFSVDRGWRFTYVNGAAERVLLKSRTELLGRCLWDEPVGQLFSEKCRRALGENEHIQFEAYSPTLGVWLRTDLYPARDGLSVYFQDVTDRKKAEEALTESRTLLKAIVEGTSDAVYAKDRSGRYLLFNPAAEARTGQRAEDVIGKDDTHVFPPEDAQRVMEKDQAIMAAMKTETYEERIFCAGVPITFLATKGPLTDSEGAVKGVFGVSRDITERKQAERELKEAHDNLEHSVLTRTRELKHQKELLETIIDAIPVMIHFFDPQGKSILINREVERVLGWSSDELHTIDIMEECYPDPVYRATVMDFMKNPGAGWRDLEVRTKSGAIVDNSWCNIRLSDGSHIGIGIDVSEHRRLEEQLRQSQKMEAIGTLAGGIAHDFNNILAAIVGNAELAMDEVDKQHPTRYNLEQIMKASLRARDLVREIVTFSRKSEKEKNTIHLGPVLEETFRLLRASLPATIEMNLQLSVLHDVVSGNASQLQQVIMNLATNASQAMPDGGRLDITLADAVISDEETLNLDIRPVDYLMISCTDTGCGIDPVTKNRIFDPFFTTKRPGSGTGLGLAVAYGIVKGHEGTISVESVPGNGSTFKVFIPKVHAEVKGIDKVKQKTLMGTERILFVDDEEPLRSLTEEMLSPLGYRVTTACNAETALSLFRQDVHGYDVVITDQAMPGMNGLRLTQELLKMRPDLPVILCTGYNELAGDLSVRSAGVRECVTKPLLKHELSAAIRKARETA